MSSITISDQETALRLHQDMHHPAQEDLKPIYWVVELIVRGCCFVTIQIQFKSNLFHADTWWEEQLKPV